MDCPVTYTHTQHARDVIKERNISEVWIRQVLEKPDLIEADPLDDSFG